MSDIEADIQVAGANVAPRITMADIEGDIAKVWPLMGYELKSKLAA